MIPEPLLEKHQATLKTFSKDRVLFNENETPKFYYQIKTGSIKMFNLTEDGKEFIQGFFEDTQSFGEPPLFGDFNYPASAMCLSDAKVYVLPKDTFLTLLKQHPDIHLKFTQMLCNRMLYKAKIIQEVSIHPPEHRVLTLLNHLKTSSNTRGLYEVNLTRQQISDLTGLRVETVIRTVKQLEKNGELTLKRHKVYI
ncbi:MAG: Crp/Fnr family transcriptional regulator [Algicola sp.]|nr:Crp/Fnr family transcriptional regulator [Algicola sp.]